MSRISRLKLHSTELEVVDLPLEYYDGDFGLFAKVDSKTIL